MEKINSYRKVFFVVLFSNYIVISFNVFSTILFVPWYITSIGAQSYGAYIGAVSVANFLTALEFGLSLIMTQRIAKQYVKKQFAEIQSSISNALFLNCIISTLIILTTILIAPFISDLFNAPEKVVQELQIAFIILGISAAININYNLSASIFQGMLKADILAKAQAISSILGILTIVIYFYYANSVVAIATGSFVKSITSTIIINVYLSLTRQKDEIALVRPTRTGTVDLFMLGFPIFISNSCKTGTESIQNVLISSLLSPALIVVFSVTQRTMQLVFLVLSPVGSSIYSALTRINSTKSTADFNQTILSANRYFSIISVFFMSIAVMINESFVKLWVGPEYYAGVWISVLFGLSFILNTRQSFLSYVLYSTGHFHKLVLWDLVYAAVKLSLLFMMMGHYGILLIPFLDAILTLLILNFAATYHISSQSKVIIPIKSIMLPGLQEILLYATLGYFIRDFLIVQTWIELLKLIFVLSIVMVTLLLMSSRPLRIEIQTLISYFRKS